MRTGKQPVDRAFIGWSRTPDKAIIPAVEALNIELLARLDAIRMPQLGRKNNLAFGRHDRFHIGKISSYLPDVKRGDCLQS